MICETCRGARLINGLPCSNCGGCGLDYCCGGTPVHPEKEEDDDSKEKISQGSRTGGGCGAS